jgi:4-diphosphocytidyl-2-C-methyl-D-erythritol kinase
MADKVRVRAAAKVNLHLRVYRRRNDGYHGILSIFQAISLTDSIVIRSLKESDTIEIGGNFDCPARETTIYKAVLAYREVTGIRTGLSISVDKRIPAGAGLGGGSSDAAAVLVGLEAMLQGGLMPVAAQGLGASIGSDVPFFLKAGAAVVSGRGEEVSPLDSRDDYRLVLAFPGSAVPTAWAYSLLDGERPDDSAEPDPGREELAAAYGGDIRRWPFANSFEGPIGRARSEIPRAKELLAISGASFAAMSGSGNAIFGVFEDEARALVAAARLRDAGFDACVSSPLARCSALD